MKQGVKYCPKKLEPSTLIEPPRLFAPLPTNHARQDVIEFGVVLLDGLDRLVGSLADVIAFGQVNKT